MKLIHIPEANCYLDCVITLANAFEIAYTESFSYLWAEEDLCYEPICHTFLSRQMPRMLKMMGMEIGIPCVSEQERKQGWTDILEGDFAMIGMDGFMIPWNPIYGALHGPHYFIVRKSRKDPQICFEPTYGLETQKMSATDLVSSSYAVIPVYRQKECAVPEYNGDVLLSQAKEVTENHPKAITNFLRQAKIWIQSGNDRTFLPARFVEALAQGRHLYGYFLRNKGIEQERAPLFWDEGYFKEWRAVKNGFYKAAVVKQKTAVFDEAYSLFVSLYEREMELAKQLLMRTN